MTKTLNTAFAAALVAASVFGASAALAAPSGDYFQGGNREPAQTENIDLFRTNSIGERAVKHSAPIDQRVDNGDYRSVAPVNAN